MPDTAVRIGRSFPLPPGFHGTAHFSMDGQYRYYLTRVWAARKPKLITIGMNPSSAGPDRDDGTIRLLERFAIREGYGSLIMLNAYALVSTDAVALLRHPAPHGEGDVNQGWINIEVSSAATGAAIIACWGVIPQARHDELVQTLRTMSLVPVYCFGKTKGGFPRHPLRTTLTLERFL